MNAAKKVKELKAGVPSKSKQQSGSKTTSLQNTGPSDKDKSAQSSTTVPPVPIRVPYSSATSKGRKGNLNGSRSSLPLHEHRLRKTALRRSTNVSPSVEQLKNNSSTLEEQMAVKTASRKATSVSPLIEQLKNNSSTLEEQVAVKTAPREATSVSPLIEQLKNNSSTLEKQIAVIRRELQSIIKAESKSEQLTRSEKHAHKTAADCEFIVEEIKKAYIKDKEDLLAKVSFLEHELNKLRTRCQHQPEIKVCSTSSMKPFSSVNGHLLLLEEVDTDHKRTNSMEQMMESLRSKIKEEDIKLKALHDVKEEKCLEPEMKLRIAINDLSDCKGRLRELIEQLKQLAAFATKAK